MKNTVPVKKNEHYTMLIEDIGNQGEGIGKIDGFTVFVEGAIPKDKIEVRIVKVAKAFAFGKLMKILEASEDRKKPECPYFPQCGGCQLQHMTEKAQAFFKEKKVQDCLERIGGLKESNVLPAIDMEDWHYYRNKAQFPVREEDGKVKIGFYARRSHRLVDIKKCLLQQKVNEKIVEAVRKYMETCHVSAYCEQTHKGLVRHILTRVGFYTGQVMVLIVVNGKKLPDEEKLVEELKKIEGIHGIVLNENLDRTNVVLGKKNRTLWGEAAIYDFIGEILFKISPHSFYQVNPVQTKKLYELALSFADLKGEENVLDLYCGIGTISLFFAKKAKNVVGVEVVEEAIVDAKENAKRNGITNAQFYCGPAEKVILDLMQKEQFFADVAVVDPPRKGCEEVVLRTIPKIGAKKIVYVSCDPATLARDLKILKEEGYQVVKAVPVEQFKMTSHVETIVLLQRETL